MARAEVSVAGAAAGAGVDVAARAEAAFTVHHTADGRNPYLAVDTTVHWHGARPDAPGVRGVAEVLVDELDAAMAAHLHDGPDPNVRVDREGDAIRYGCVAELPAPRSDVFTTVPDAASLLEARRRVSPPPELRTAAHGGSTVAVAHRGELLLGVAGPFVPADRVLAE